MNEIEYDDTWLLKWINRRIEQNRSVLALFVGPTGSGKSYSAISTAVAASKRFTVNNIVFDVHDFVKLIRHGNLQHGDIVIFDDAGLNINSRTWQSMQNNIFSMVTQSFRYQQIITLITTPDWSYIDWQVRNLFDLFFEATEVQGVMKPFIHFPSPLMGDRRPWRKYPKVQVNGKVRKLTLIKFGLAPQSVLDEYEARKKKHLEDYYEKFERQLDFTEKIENEKLQLTMKKIEREKIREREEEMRDKRNSEIIKMIAEGATYNQVASKYGISTKTVQRIVAMS